MKPTGAQKDRFDPLRQKPPVWIEGEFIVTSATTKPQPAASPRVGRKRSRAARDGLSALVMRLLAVATACAATIVFAVVWAMVIG